MGIFLLEEISFIYHFILLMDFIDYISPVKRFIDRRQLTLCATLKRN